MHQVAAHLPAAVGQAVGEQGAGGVEQQPRRADAVAGQHHDFGVLGLQVAVAVVVGGAGGAAGVVHQNLADAGVGNQAGALFEGLGPKDDVAAGGRAQVFADIGGASVPGGGADGVVRRPPVPAQFVEGLAQEFAAPADGQRRRGTGGLGRIGRVALQPADAVHPVVLVVVRFQLKVVHRPVVGHAVQRPQAEVGGMEAGEMGAPVDGAAAYGVVHIGRNGGVILVDGIVLRQAAEVGVGVEVGLPVQLGLGFTDREGVERHPAALFQTDDLDAGLGEAPGKSAAGGAGADDENVGDVAVIAHRLLAPCAGGVAVAGIITPAGVGGIRQLSLYQAASYWERRHYTTGAGNISR